MAKLLRTLRLIATCLALVFAPVYWEAACCACEETEVADAQSDGAASASDDDHERPCSEACASCCACCGRAVAMTTKLPSPLLRPGVSARSDAIQRAPPKVEPEELLQVPKAA